MSTENLLEVRGLRTWFHTEAGTVKAVDGVDFHIRRNETLGVVGESGCGKSVTSLSIMQLIDAPGRVEAGEILFKGEDLLKKSRREMQHIRGNQISMVFQEPMTSLNPVHTIGDQITEAIILHQRLDKLEAIRKAVQMLERVGIPDPAQRVREYPNQLSGGMRQRVMIAMALSCNPSLLIADEPTTALDVTIQAQILELMRSLKSDLGASIMIITHDLGVIAEMADNVVVMYAGKVVEYGEVDAIFSRPHHPYTRELLDSIPRLTDEPGRRLQPIEGSIPDIMNLPTGCSFNPRCRSAIGRCRELEPRLETLPDGHQVRCWKYSSETAGLFAPSGPARERLGDAPPAVEAKSGTEAILRVRDLTMHFPIHGGVFQTVVGHVKAVDGLSFDIHRGETLGLVGESGCGKTTTGRLILRLLEATAGKVEFEGRDILGMGKRELRSQRRDMQIIFQDPYASLNPRMTVGDIIAEAFVIQGEGRVRKPVKELADRVALLLEQVGLQPDHARRYPHQFSGGQRQRIGVARAICLDPKLIVCDEPMSALDVSIQAQIINLLEDLQGRLGLTYLFIAHNLSVVKHIADRVAVMYLGRIVELSSTKDVFDGPLHPYTVALLAAVPVPDTRVERKRFILQGDVPSPSKPPPGCHFHTRCPQAMDVCRKVDPKLVDAGAGHLVACHLRSSQSI
ncbi:MAG: ABC transporter ATP-binding protein [Spirochaetota bacterium]